MIDDLAGARGGRVVEQTVERPVVRRLAGAEVVRRVQDEMQAAGLERRAQGARMAQEPLAIAQHARGGACTWTQVNPAASKPLSIGAVGNHPFGTLSPSLRASSCRPTGRTWAGGAKAVEGVDGHIEESTTPCKTDVSGSLCSRERAVNLSGRPHAPKAHEHPRPPRSPAACTSGAASRPGRRRGRRTSGCPPRATRTASTDGPRPRPRPRWAGRVLTVLDLHDAVALDGRARGGNRPPARTPNRRIRTRAGPLVASRTARATSAPRPAGLGHEQVALRLEPPRRALDHLDGRRAWAMARGAAQDHEERRSQSHPRRGEPGTQRWAVPGPGRPPRGGARRRRPGPLGLGGQGGGVEVAARSSRR